MAKKNKFQKSRESANTIGGYWKIASEIIPLYLEQQSSSQNKRKPFFENVKKLEEEVNKSPIPEFISENFVSPYVNFDKEKIKVIFDGEDGKLTFGKWIASYDRDNKILKLNSIAIYEYVSCIKKDGDSEDIGQLDRENNFAELRLRSFKKQLSKLPEQYIMFLAILKGIADVTLICVSDTKSSADIKTDEHVALYFSSLWAFKQFEEFYQKFQNRSIRADYQIIWYEGEWIEP